MLDDKSKQEISKRLRYFAHMRFGSLKELAAHLGVTSSTLSQYTTGKSIPGNTMQSRLRDIGCDIEWLMTGESEPVQTEDVSISQEFKRLRKEFSTLLREYNNFNKRLQKVESLLFTLTEEYKIPLLRREEHERRV